MINKDNWEETKIRFMEYWARENHDRPLISIKAPKENAKYIAYSVPERLEDRWLDTEYVIKAGRKAIECTYYGGEAFPMLWPNLDPDVFGAFYGSGLVFGPETSWSVHNISSIDNLVFNENGYYKKIIEMTKAMSEDSKGDYIVGITDIHSGLDALVSLIGPEGLCYEIYDNPESVKEASFILFEGFKKVVNELHSIISANQRGSTCWLGPWHIDLWYPTSCDFCCMISDSMFKEFVLPELIQEINFLDASIFHLDGPGALKHLDTLLEIERLKGIQWVYGSGQPTASHWIEVLQRIQRAKKLIHVSITPGDLPVLLDNIEPEGVMYDLWVSSEYEAKQLIKMAERTKKRVF